MFSFIYNIMHYILLSKYFHIGAVIALYWVVSILTVFVNKTLLSSSYVDLEAPFFIVWFQCFISVCVCLFLRFCSSCTGSNWFPNGSPFTKDSFGKVFPVTVLFISMIVFNTLCLKYVGVSFYYIGRSLTTVFNVACTNFLLKERVSLQVLTCCLVIVAGFVMGIDQESALGTLSVAGTLSGVGASLSLALYSIYTKKVLPSIGNHIWLLSYYNNVYSCFILTPAILFSKEFSIVSSSPKLQDSTFWGMMIIGGLCGFSIGYVTSLQITTTSPLTHNVSGTAKACTQTVIATFYYDENKSFLWWLSNFVVLGGSAAYTAIRQREMERNFASRKIPI